MKSINLSAPGVSIGHIHLKVADLERAIVFYRDVPEFEVTTDSVGKQRFSPLEVTTITLA